MNSHNKPEENPSCFGSPQFMGIVLHNQPRARALGFYYSGLCNAKLRSCLVVLLFVASFLWLLLDVDGKEKNLCC